MDILLAAVNAKYIHTNLAVYSLRAYCREFSQRISLREYTINQEKDQILKDIYHRAPEVLCFSCYIWNISYVKELIRDIHKILPDTVIWQEVRRYLTIRKIFLRKCRKSSALCWGKERRPSGNWRNIM